MEMTENWTEQDWMEWEKWVQSGFGTCDPSCSPGIYYSTFNYGGIFA